VASLGMIALVEVGTL